MRRSSFSLRRCLLLIVLNFLLMFIVYYHYSVPANSDTSVIVRNALTNLGNLVKSRPPELCKIEVFGTGWGSHRLCHTSYQKGCYSISYGVSDDWTFDQDVVTRLGCTSFLMDPTVQHNSVWAHQIYFSTWAAPSYHPDANPSWVTMSPTRLKEALKIDRLSVLKMDCEGCEYALYNVTMNEDPSFFKTVDQFVFEVHLPRYWMSSVEVMNEFGKLLVMLEEAGLQFIHVELSSCSDDHEAHGCLPELLALGYPCSKGTMCQNFLFARI